MISWITTVILSAPRMSTSGRAPWFSAIIRFWISVESLNRPPTLLTIYSSFSSSSIDGSSSAANLDQQRHEVVDSLVQICVHHLLVIPAGFPQLPPSVVQSPGDGGLIIGR